MAGGVHGKQDKNVLYSGLGTEWSKGVRSKARVNNMCSDSRIRLCGIEWVGGRKT